MIVVGVACELMAEKNSRPHSYILLREKDRCSRGCLLELQSDGSYFRHSHVYVFPHGPPLRCTIDEVAALSEEECVVLDGIDYAAHRYTVYSTPGKLKWGCGLKVGDTILARLPGRNGHGSSGGGQQHHTTAIIRWYGETEGDDHRFGVEITVCMTVSYSCLSCPDIVANSEDGCVGVQDGD